MKNLKKHPKRIIALLCAFSVFCFAIYTTANDDCVDCGRADCEVCNSIAENGNIESAGEGSPVARTAEISRDNLVIDVVEVNLSRMMVRL